MTVADAVRHWLEAPSAVRSEYAATLLARKDVAAFLESYDGARSPKRVAAAAQAAGLARDDVDAAMIGILLEWRPGSSAAGRWVES